MRLSSEQRASLERSAAQYERDLYRAAHYLAGRGLTEATARSFRLGVVVDPLPGDEHFTGRLSIPYLTRSGVVAVRYRCLAQHDCNAVDCAKYLGYEGASTHLFNVSAFFQEGDTVIVTEGEMDAVILTQCSLPAVGVPGSHNWKPHYSRIFEDYAHILVFADGDDAGKKFGKKVASAVPGARVIAMPDGMDVNDVYLHEDYGIDWLASKCEG